MKKEDKNKVIDGLAEQLASNGNFYLADISELDAEKTSKLRRECFNKGIQVRVVKNTLLKKAMEKANNEGYADFYPTLVGATSIWFSETGSAPAKLIKEFRKTEEKPVLKGAFIEESLYVGDDQLEFLAALKSKNELIGDVIGLLQSPAKNVISALQSGGNKLSGIVKTLSERPE